jgi:WD40 repeat protein
MEPASLTKLIRGDLDWIVMKALEKQRTRRYETANGFAMDVQRYLAGEAVLAAPPSAGYRLRKFARKYRTPLRVAGAFLLLLIVAVIASAWQAFRATLAERAARASEEEAQDQRREADEAKKEAEQQRDELRRLNYIGDMNRAQHAWEANNLIRTRQLLDQHRPKPGETDLRGFEWHYLNRLFHGDLWTAKAYGGFVASVAYTPDGKRLYGFGKTTLPSALYAVGDLPGEVKLWDAASGRLLPLTLNLPTDKMRRVALSPDGMRMAASCWDQGFQVWDLTTGQPMTVLEVPPGEGAYELGFSADGKRLVTLSLLIRERLAEGGTCIVRIWDLASRKVTWTLDKLGSLMHVPAFSPDGKYLAIPVYSSRLVQVVDAATGQEAFTCKNADEFVAHAIFSPDGKRLAASGQQGATIWDVATRENRVSLRGAAHLGMVLAFSPDGKKLAMGSLEGLVELWDAGAGQLLDTFKGHGGEIRALAFNPDGASLASAGADGAVRVWDTTGRGRAINLFRSGAHLGQLDLSPDTRAILAETVDYQQFQLMDTTTGTLRGKPFNAIGGALSFDWTADGRKLIHPGAGKKIAIHDADTGALVREFEVDREVACETAISPDGLWCAHSGPGVTVKVLRADTGALHRSITGLVGAVQLLAFNPDGSQLAGADLGGWVKVWDLATGRETMSVQVSDVYMTRMRFSPDGRRLAIGGNQVALRSGEARILDLEGGRETLQLRGHTIMVTDIAFSPDGQRVATSSADKTIRIWDLATGQEILTLKGHTEGVRSIRFLANGQKLMSASNDGTIRVWDATPLAE